MSDFDKQLIEYNKTRKCSDKTIVCHAPFVNINFDLNGNMTACCYNRKDVIGTYPKNSIKEAWFGEKADALRKNILNKDLSGGCMLCREHIMSGNFEGAISRNFDSYATSKFDIRNKINNLLNNDSNIPYPKVLEFEISNTCNLECAMCNGYFSSTIRKNRENLPELPMKYGADFVNQISDFIPHLSEMKFLGGEPFLIDLYYDIWDRILEINPRIKVYITTNGTVLNNRAKEILSKLNVFIVLSIDSMNPATYEEIRVGAKFNKVHENLSYFKELTSRKKTKLTIAACPMIKNYKDLPGLLEYCNVNKIFLRFNTLWMPEELSFRSLSSQKLEEVIAFLNNSILDISFNKLLDTNNVISKNINVYKDLINTLSLWLEEKKKFKLSKSTSEYVNVLAYPESIEIDEYSDIVSDIVDGVCFFYQMEQTGNKKSPKSLSKYSKYKNFRAYLEVLRDNHDVKTFIESYLEVFDIVRKNMNIEGDYSIFHEKIELLKSHSVELNKNQRFIYDLIEIGLLDWINYIEIRSKENLFQSLKNLYS